MLVHRGDVMYRVSVVPRGPETNEYLPGGGFIQLVAASSKQDVVLAFTREQWADDEQACMDKFLERLTP